MVSFNKHALISSILLSSYVFAAPSTLTAKHATHRVRSLPHGVDVVAFHPPNTFQTFGDGVDLPLTKRVPGRNPVEQDAISVVASRLGLKDDAVSFKSSFSGEASTHAYLKQKINGIEVANAVANIALNNDNKLVSFGNNFVSPKRVASSTPSITSQAAIASAEAKLDAKYNGFPTTIEFFAKDNGEVALAHVVQVQNNDHWFETFVDAHTGEILGANDFVSDSTFRVIPINKQDPRTGTVLTVNPEDTVASPNGWVAGTETAGNNAISFKGSSSSTTKQSSSGVFNFTPDDTKAPTVQSNIDAARTNAFFVVNSIHDITYRYGFTEAAFNFQNDNLGKGGKGNDRVTISVQDSGGTNNANFATPADGSSGSMRMYLWTITSPQRDGALENDIVAHEATHGTSNRLTGGGTGRCLQTTEAGGMGEGWSDAFAEWLEQTASVPDFTLGSYVVNDPAGIRSHPYSTNQNTNPLTYSSLQTLTEVHDIGEVWATILHDVFAGLVSANGFSSTAKTDPTGTAGNVVWLHLFIDALALQPCNPTFLTARDAWIQADKNRYSGANACTLWKAFAGRGLGVNAASHKNNAAVPSGC